MIPFVRNVLKNLLTGPATRNYPAAPSPTVEGGRFRLDMNIGDCVFCGLCIEACPTRALTMTNEFKLADRTRASLIYEKDELLVELGEGMEEPPHPRRLGPDERSYFLGLPADDSPDLRFPHITGEGPDQNTTTKTKKDGGKK